ncbi:MAG: hypothetical protein M0C28_13605 [Candidatus Moduliflexus flocculans]|nr:hypothetical protein [Candidatus Moduliflexus flocculans]
MKDAGAARPRHASNRDASPCPSDRASRFAQPPGHARTPLVVVMALVIVVLAASWVIPSGEY